MYVSWKSSQEGTKKANVNDVPLLKMQIFLSEKNGGQRLNLRLGGFRETRVVWVYRVEHIFLHVPFLTIALNLSSTP